MDLRVEKLAEEYNCFDEAVKCLEKFYNNHPGTIQIDSVLKEISTPDCDLYVVLETKFMFVLDDEHYQSSASWYSLGGMINRGMIEFKGEPILEHAIEYRNGNWVC
uniref:Uncharacterized protein n=1 Tax=viral metagenome TaxID=1070528 RepID=A0A6C0AD71_9ZZZZ